MQSIIPSYSDHLFSSINVNFSYQKTAALWHVVDGMGTYSAYRIFTFVPKRGEFVELRPACGNGFINVTLRRSKKMLRNAYVKDNR